MDSLINKFDSFTKYAFVGVVALFVIISMFSGCKISSGVPEVPEVTEAATQPSTIAGMTLTTPSTISGITSTTPSTTADIVSTTETSLFNLGEFRLTAYCKCEKCCGQWANEKTATGTTPVQGRTIAVDQDVIPYGSEVIINGHTYTAEDTGSAIVGNCIDIYFDSHEDAEKFGVQYAEVLLKVGDA